MTYKIGTRVKKVRGKENIGSTGLVVGHQDHGGGYDLVIRSDQPWVDTAGNHFPAGTDGFCQSRSWEPVVPSGHAPGIKGACEPLDKLLSEVRHASVE